MVIVFFVILLTAVEADITSFLKTGDINCNKRKEFLITASFQAKNGDVYLWATDYMTRLKLYDNGELRIYDTYPKSAHKWTVEDFPYPESLKKTPPTVIYADNDGEFVTFFLSTDTANKGKSLLFRYVDNRYVFDGFNPIDFTFLDRHVDHTLHFHYFMLMARDRRRRAIYESLYAFSDNQTYFADFENKRIIIKGRVAYDDSLTGCLMVVHGEDWSFGYSFQGDFSVPTYSKLKRDDTELFTIVNTKFSDALVVSFHKENVFQDFGVNYRFIVPNSHWFGCASDDWCFRGYIDEATTLWNNTLLVFSGRWLRVFNTAKSLPVQTKYIHEYYSLNIPSYVDAVFTDRKNKLTFILKDNTYFVLQYAISSWFMEEDVTAMLSNNTEMITAITFLSIDFVPEIFVFGVFQSKYGILKALMNTGNKSNSYYGINSIKSITEILSDVPIVVDAAFKDPESDDIFLVNSLFSYKVKGGDFYTEKNHQQLEFQSLFGCNLQVELNPLTVDVTMYRELLKEGLAKEPLFAVEKYTFWKAVRVTIIYFFIIAAIVVIVSVVITTINYKIKSKEEEEKEQSINDNRQKIHKSKRKRTHLNNATKKAKIINRRSAS